jgi:hypothetical protein
MLIWHSHTCLSRPVEQGALVVSSSHPVVPSHFVVLTPERWPEVQHSLSQLLPLNHIELAATLNEGHWPALMWDGLPEILMTHPVERHQPPQAIQPFSGIKLQKEVH